MKYVALFTASLLALSGATPASATMADECFRRCEAIQDSMTSITQSGQISQQYEACMEQCGELQAAQNAVRECIKNAPNDEAKQACRSDYMDNRPDHSW